MVDSARAEAFTQAWGRRSETRSLSEKMNTQHWFYRGWDAHGEQRVTDEATVNALLFKYDNDPNFGVREFTAALEAARRA
jgi:hypothetical protein